MSKGAQAVLTFIGMLVVAELAWDRAHGSFGIHRREKLIVLLLAIAGTLALEVYRRLRRPRDPGLRPVRIHGDELVEVAGKLDAVEVAHVADDRLDSEPVRSSR